MIHDIIDVIRKSEYILLASHENPDGDAIGSVVGMANICQYFQVDYAVVLEKLPEEYSFLTQNIHITQKFDGKYDTFICLDCGDISRLGSAKNYFDHAKTTINIDHHHTNNDFADFNYVEKDASSTSELIFNILEAGEVPFTESICMAVYAGMVTDTGGFMYSCTNPSTHVAAAKLIATSFDFTEVYYRLMYQKTEETMKLQGIAVQNLKKLCKGKVFLSYLKTDDFARCKAVREDASSIVSYIKNIKGCEVAVFVYPGSQSGTYKISFRSNAPYDVSKVAAVFGGGGHIRASGATATGTLEEVLNQIKKTLDASEGF